MKGKIKADHIPVNKFELLFIGLPPLVVTKQSGLEKELDSVDLPDRTTATGGQSKTIEWTMEIPLHHELEQAAMQAWLKENQDPVTPTAKKNGTFVAKSLSNAIIASRSIIGARPVKFTDPDWDMANEGEMASVTWTMKADDILPV